MIRLLLIAALTAGQPQFLQKDSPGIIFTRLNEISLATNHWKICFYQDLKPLLKEEAKAQAMNAPLKQICNQLQAQFEDKLAENHCLFILHQLEAHADRMSAKRDTIRSFSHTRSRRAPIEIIGSIAKGLFGIMDAESAKEYDAQIDRLKNDANFQFDLIKKQTSLIDNVIQRQNASIRQNQMHFEQIANSIKEIHNISTETKELRVIAKFNMLSTAISLVLSQQESLADDFIRLLSSAIHGQTTTIIPKQVLINSLKEIESLLPKTEILPLNIVKENVLSIFQVCTLKSTLYDDRVLIEMAIPLISPTLYTLFESTCTPFARRDKTFTLINTHRFFASDADLQSIIPLSDREEQECSKIGDRIICETHSTIIAKKDNCEVYLLNMPKAENLHEHCQVAEIPSKNYFTQIRDTNDYFLFVREEYPIKVICAKKTSIIQASQSGYLRLQDDCRATSDHFIISTRRRGSSNATLNLSNSPALKFEDINADAHTQIARKAHEFEPESIADLIDEANELRHREGERHDIILSSKTTALTSASIIYFAITIGLFALVYFKLRKDKRINNEPIELVKIKSNEPGRKKSNEPEKRKSNEPEDKRNDESIDLSDLESNPTNTTRSNQQKYGKIIERLSFIKKKNKPTLTYHPETPVRRSASIPSSPTYADVSSPATTIRTQLI